MTLAKIKIAWAAFLTILFFAFCSWYGGAGKPITAEEGEVLLDRMRQTFDMANSESRGFYENIVDMIPRDDGKEFYAVNLENLKDGPEARRSGQAYARIVMPLLIKRAGHPVFVSERAGLMLGEYGNDVDRIAVVRYRSLRDLIDMVLEPVMQEGEVHKFGALNHTEVIIARPTITFMNVRFVLALILTLFGLAGIIFIDLVSNRMQKHRA